MPLVLPGSLVLGPKSAANPSSLVDYLASISKASFYALWKATHGLAPHADGSGGTVVPGGAVGHWAPVLQSGFNYKFIQPTAASRPGYSETLSPPRPLVYGNGASWSMFLNSTSALNLDCTILVSYESSNLGGAVWSQSGANWSIRSAVSAPPSLFVSGASIEASETAHVTMSQPTGVAYKRRRCIAFQSPLATTRYGTPFYLFSYSGTGLFGSDGIAEIAITPKLTASECVQAMKFLG